MYSFLTLIIGLFIKLSLIQAYAPQNYGGIRTGYKDRTNQMTNNQFNNEQPPQNGVQFQDSIPTYNHEQHSIVSIGNGYNKNNVVILSDGHRRHFQERADKPIFGIPNANQPKLGSSVVSITNIGNGRNNQNSVVIQDDYHSTSQSQNGVQFQDSIPTYNEEHNIFSVGNGNNKNNVVVLSDGYSRHFQQSAEKPIFGNRNSNQPKLGSNVVSTTNIGNGRNNQNSVIIQDDYHSTSHLYTNNNPTNDNQRYNHVNYFRNNRGPPNSGNTLKNRNLNSDRTDFDYSQIGHGPENRNTVIINGKVYSSPETTVIHRQDVRKTDIISNNGYHSLPNDDDLKVLPTENHKKYI